MPDSSFLDWPFLDDGHRKLASKLRAWIGKEIAAHKTGDIDEYCRACVKKLGAGGWLNYVVPASHGGVHERLDVRSLCLLREHLAYADGLADFAFAMQGLGTASISLSGSDELKSEYLPPVARGERIAAFAMSEPDAGADVAAMTTTAKRDGNHFIIDGTKTWISNGIYGSCFAVLVKTDPDIEPRYKGTSLFLCEKGEGFRVGRKLEKLGYKGIDSAELIFEDYRIPADRLIGGEEGSGFHHAVGGLELGRINVAARGVGVANAALKEAVAYSQVRRTMGKPICQHQAIQLKLGDMATRVEAARLLVEQASRAYDKGERCDMEAGMAKLFASEAAVENALEAMRIHGGYGYSKEFNVERYYRDAPLMCIGEGTNEIQRIIIAKQLIERNPV